MNNKILHRVQRMVRKTIKPTNDKRGDLWQYPAETMTLGTGDCEDLAILKLALVRLAGGDGFIERCQDRDTLEGHMVCVVGDWVLDVYHVMKYEDFKDSYVTYGGNKNTRYDWEEIIARIDSQVSRRA